MYLSSFSIFICYFLLVLSNVCKQIENKYKQFIKLKEFITRKSNACSLAKYKMSSINWDFNIA